MLPYISIFGRSIPSYSLTTMVGCVLAVLYFKTGKRKVWCQAVTLETSFLWAAFGALVGAKLLSLLTQMDRLIQDLPFLTTYPTEFIQKYFLSGFVFYGGLYGALFCAWLYARIHHVPFCELSACLSPVFPLIHGFGRIGCFLVGCCYGMPAEGRLFGVTYHQSSIAPNDIPLIPIQLYEAAAELLLFLCMYLLLRKGKEYGTTALAVHLTGYGIVRFLLEFLRGDSYRGFIGPLSLSQWLSIATVFVGVIVFVVSGADLSRQRVH